MKNMSQYKVEMPVQDPLVRNKNFEEVALGYTPEMAMEEAARCLGCKHRPCVEGCPVSVQIPDFISLICRKGNRLEQTVSACGHPAVYAKRCRNIAGQITIVPIEAFHIILVWLCDKGLHLHIVSGH